MSSRIINIFTNETQVSEHVAHVLTEKLKGAGYTPFDTFSPKAELLICIGGDGTVLQAMHQFDFPDMPMIGINTGHLGFFQELYPSDIDEFIFKYQRNDYTIQSLSTVRANVFTDDEKHSFTAMNEIVIRGIHRSSSHMNLSIGDSFIERFSGDGILISTPAGSTAYNYALGGAIVDPRLALLQVTPIAPMNTTAYRSFTSSILLPSDRKVAIIPEAYKSSLTYVIADGFETEFDDAKKITVEYSDTSVKMIRFQNYDFWNKVKTKFL